MKPVIGRYTTSGLILLLVVMAIAMAATTASAADRILMKVPGIPGSSTVVNHSGWINVNSLAGSGVAPAANGGGAQPCQVVVQKPIDIASPHLWADTVNGHIFTSPITIQVLATTADGGTYVQYEIELTNTEITSIGDAGSNGLPVESLTLRADKVSLTFNTQNPDSGAITSTTTSFTCAGSGPTS